MDLTVEQWNDAGPADMMSENSMCTCSGMLACIAPVCVCVHNGSTHLVVAGALPVGSGLRGVICDG